MKKTFHANINAKKGGVAILIPDKIDFKTKLMKKDKEGHDIIIKGSIKKRILHSLTCAPNIGAPKYVKQILTHKRRN